MDSHGTNGTAELTGWGCPVEETSANGRKETRHHLSPFRQWRSPNVPSRCTYHQAADKRTDTPHPEKKTPTRPYILPNILHNIGDTPLVQVNRIKEKEVIRCEMLVKCEYFNPGGSVKDRIGLRMIEDAERIGAIKPGDVIIEPTSGNTGIGIALAAAVKGYRCIIVMPDKMSMEKENILRALGAEIVRTPSSARFHSPESHISVARRLMTEIPDSHILDQYRNPSNPLAHYDGTAEEILKACEGKVDMVVIGTGTGGTLTGVARKIKEVCPKCKIIGVDAVGSILAVPEELNKTDTTFYELEGVGGDFVPSVLDRSLVDRWYKVTDQETFVMARRLMREEGLLCGGSSGTAMAAAMKAVKDFHLTADQRCVTIFPDSVRNYMTRFLCDDWMIQRGFLEVEKPSEDSKAWWWNLKVNSLRLLAPLTVRPEVTIQETLDLLNKEGFDQVPVVDESGKYKGMATVRNIMSHVVKNKAKKSDPVSKIICTKIKHITMDTSLGELSRLLDTDACVMVVRDIMQNRGSTSDAQKTMIWGIATRIDLLNFITSGQSNGHMTEQQVADQI